MGSTNPKSNIQSMTNNQWFWFKQNDIRLSNKIPIEVECSICLEICGIEYIKLKCGHLYHEKCINKWECINNSCCICKKPIN